jgi:hypothetical protein
MNASEPAAKGRPAGILTGRRILVAPTDVARLGTLLGDRKLRVSVPDVGA